MERSIQVFIIREDIEKEFKEVIGNRIASICSAHNVTVDYAFQDINDIPGTLPEGRTKPWGTGQAALAAKNVIKTPFIVINADDYYGKEGFKAVHEYLVNGGKSCMAGFMLKNTLSDNGGVTRGICKMDEQNNLTEVVETNPLSIPHHPHPEERIWAGQTPRRKPRVPDAPKIKHDKMKQFYMIDMERKRW